MKVAVEADPTPFTRDETGTLRIAGTRVTLDTIAEAFGEGLSAEEIAQQFPVVPLAEVYAAIAYYLRRRVVLDSYLDERQASAADLQAKIEAALPPNALRERLLARRSGRA